MKRILFFLFCVISNICLSEAQDLFSSVEKNNPQLRMAREANVAQLAELSAENRLGNTSVEYSPFYQQGVDGTSSSELIVSQEFDFPSLYVARGRSVNAQRQVLDIQYQILRRDIMLEVRQLCCDIVAARSMQALLRSRISTADSLQTAFERRLALGDATILDLNRIKVDRMAVNAEYVRNESQLQTLMFDLQRLNGGISADVTDCSFSTIAQGMSEIVQEVPLEVANAQASLLSSRQELTVAKQGWLPSLTLGYRRNTELREAQNGFLLGVSVPLFGNGSKVKAARLRRNVAEEEVTRATIEQDARSQTLKTQARQLHLILEAYDETLLNQTLNLLKRAVLAGELSIIDYYNEVDRIYSILQDRLTSETEYYKTLIEINRENL